jgi:hypothetical protein
MDLNLLKEDQNKPHSETHKPDKTMQGSPMPKIFTPHTDPNGADEPKKQTSPPPDTIQEERLSMTSSKYEGEIHELPPTPPSYSLKDQCQTPVNEKTLFYNIDYTGMSVKDLISRSARRVRVLENGKEVHDITWTEFKNKKSANMSLGNSENKKVPESINKNESSHRVLDENYIHLDPKANTDGKKKYTNSQDIEYNLRRSIRLAKLKSHSTTKRKITPGKPQSIKKLKYN